MNNLEEKLDKFLTPDFAPEDSLNASILRKAMEMEVNKSFKISIVVAVAVGILTIGVVLIFVAYQFCLFSSE